MPFTPAQLRNNKLNYALELVRLDEHFLAHC
jgi:hypothetical protein